jgi:hypothetical protein
MFGLSVPMVGCSMLDTRSWTWTVQRVDFSTGGGEWQRGGRERHDSPLDSTEIVTYNSNAAKQHCRGSGDPPGGLGGKTAIYVTALN